MQRMLTQIGTPQDNQQLQNQLWVFLPCLPVRSIPSMLFLLAYNSTYGASHGRGRIVFLYREGKGF